VLILKKSVANTDRSNRLTVLSLVVIVLYDLIGFFISKNWAQRISVWSLRIRSFHTFSSLQRNTVLCLTFARRALFLRSMNMLTALVGMHVIVFKWMKI